MTGRRRKGMSIVECVILMVVLGIAIWAIMSTAVWSTELQTFTRANMGLFIAANNWFEAAEAVPPGSFDVSAPTADFTAAQERVIALLGGVEQFPYSADVSRLETANGINTLQLTLSLGGSSRNVPLVVSRDINRYSNATAPDNAVTP